MHKTFFKKTVLVALVVALGVASLPLITVAASGEYDPPLPQGELSSERLEKIWAFQQRHYERLGRHFDRADALVEKIQRLIDRAEENGKDVTALQAALDAFEEALKEAHPIYESAKGIINAHQGFDENGKVTDPEKARETVEEMRAKFKEINEAMNGTGRALFEALKTFREANPPPPKQTPTP
ncbi:MAG TPA: hypothetical protein VNK49_14740 [Anaerolineales bacterium]|nr:hypothetical protein [Anaerolineales bacterium]